MAAEFPTTPVSLFWPVTILFIKNHVGQYLIGSTNDWIESANVNVLPWSVSMFGCLRFPVFSANGRKYTDDIGLVHEVLLHFIR